MHATGAWHPCDGAHALAMHALVLASLAAGDNACSTEAVRASNANAARSGVSHTMNHFPASHTLDDRWRHTHMGCLLGNALRQFDLRVRSLMGEDAETPLALSNLAERDKVGAAHIHITRHLSLKGDRLVDLAQRAGMSKQAMADLVDQCEAWGLVQRVPDPLDGRAKRVVYTASGLEWHHAFRRAVAQAEAEFEAAVGVEIATVVRLGLEAYGSEAGREV